MHFAQNSRVVTAFNKTFNDFSKNSRKINMTQNLTKFVNHIAKKKQAG
jgi:hypothetical protein